MIPHAAGCGPQRHKLCACYNSHSQYKQKLQTASALPIDPFGLTSIQPKVSLSFITWMTGSGLQPCGPVTQLLAVGRLPEVGVTGTKKKKSGKRSVQTFDKLFFCFSDVAFFKKNIVQNFFRSCFSASQKVVFFRKSGNIVCFFFEKRKVQLLRSCVFDFSELGVLLLRTCLLSLSPPPLLVFSLRLRTSF